MKEREVAVSIVTHLTRPDELRKALSCALASEAVGVATVVDNSPDTSLENVARDCGARYIHVENRGYGAGHNESIRRSLAEGFRYHLVMNADVWWKGDVPAAMAEYLDSDPRIGMAMPKVFYPDGDLQYACRMLPTPLDLFAKRFLPKKLTQKQMERYLLEDADHDKPFNVPYLLGSFLFFRCEALRKEGLFDERFFMYPEDIDITRRLHRHWLTMFYPGATIIHAHAASSRKSGKMLKIHLANMIKYFNKWGWILDGERRRFNRRLLREMPRLTGERPRGRG